MFTSSVNIEWVLPFHQLPVGHVLQAMHFLSLLYPGPVIAFNSVTLA